MRGPRTFASTVASVLALMLLCSPMPADAQDEGDGDLDLLAGAGGTLLAAWASDAFLYDGIRQEPGGPLAPVAAFGTKVGKPMWFLSGLGTLYLGGKVLDQPGLSDGALHALEALIASGIANGFLKLALGRCRPDADLDCHSRDFRGFELEDHLQSFPSGHAVVAFSLATTLAHETDSDWIGGLGYGAAGVVAWSRVHRGRHWVSDVIGGAIVGVTASRLTLNWLDSRGSDEDDRFRVGVVPGGFGVKFPVRFSRR